MALQICGGTAFGSNHPTPVSTPVSHHASMQAEVKGDSTPQAFASVRGADLMKQAMSIFNQHAFDVQTEEETVDVYDEYTITYHKLSEHEAPRQLLRDINCKTGGALTQEQMDGICANLGRYFDIHYVLHGGILIDYRYYDPFGDYINSELLTEDDNRFTPWQMQVFDTEDNMYAYGLDDQTIANCRSMIAHHCKDLI